MRAAGNSDPSRNIPFLTTVEAFALKGNNFAAERAAFLAGDDEAQRALIDANKGRLILENVDGGSFRSEEHTFELQSLMRISYAVFCLKKKNEQKTKIHIRHSINSE